MLVICCADVKKNYACTWCTSLQIGGCKFYVVQCHVLQGGLLWCGGRVSVGCPSTRKLSILMIKNRRGETWHVCFLLRQIFSSKRIIPDGFELRKTILGICDHISHGLISCIFSEMSNTKWWGPGNIEIEWMNRLYLYVQAPVWWDVSFIWVFIHFVQTSDQCSLTRLVFFFFRFVSLASLSNLSILTNFLILIHAGLLSLPLQSVSATIQTSNTVSHVIPRLIGVQ